MGPVTHLFALFSTFGLALEWSHINPLELVYIIDIHVDIALYKVNVESGGGERGFVGVSASLLPPFL